MTQDIAPDVVGRADERPDDRPHDDPTGSALLEDLVTGRDVWPVLAPVIELETGAPAGYQALPRGPVGHPLQDSEAMYAAARRDHRVAELDVLAWERALEVALHSRMQAPAVLFVTVDPGALSASAPASEPPPDLLLLRRQGVHVIAEIPERALVDDPSGVLAFAARARAWGCGIALDGVGARPASLALVPLLRPDVVTLDLSVIQSLPGPMVAQAMTAVTAFAEEHGAVVAAEGVESDEREQLALVLGATHARGGRYGPPSPPWEDLLARSALWRPIVPQIEPPRTPRDSGFALSARNRSPRRSSKRLLLEVARHIERQATEMGGMVILVSVQDDRHFDQATRRRFAALARHAAFVGVIGSGLATEPAPGVHGGDIATSDPLYWEWNLVVFGPHYGVALTARDQGDTGAQLDRRFDYVLTYDRPTVLDTARLLFSRISSLP